MCAAWVRHSLQRDTEGGMPWTLPRMAGALRLRTLCERKPVFPAGARKALLSSTLNTTSLPSAVPYDTKLMPGSSSAWKQQ